MRNLSRVNFWPKVNIQNSACTKPFLKFGSLMQLTCLIFSIKMEKCFDDIQNVKKLKFEEDWAELRQKNCFLRQSWTKHLEQNRDIQ